jgi:hypothetical protein
MRFLRNDYFWLSLGSIAFFVLMAFSHSFYVGFATACILAEVWYAVDHQKHPGPPRGLKRRYMDYETGELRTEENDSAEPGSSSP